MRTGSPRAAAIIYRAVAVLGICAIALILAAILANPAKAEAFTVTNTDDSGAGSLRDAIFTANGNGESDTITFDLPDDSTITLTIGQLIVANDTASPDLTIDGTTASNLTVSGNNTSRVFRISSGAEATIAGLTVTGGDSSSVGGGISNSGTLTVNSSTISGNSADSDGGGISNSGTLTVNSSTISGNSADSDGGGISNTDTLTVNSSTISGNSATARGGGIFSFTDAVSSTTPDPAERTTIRNSTISTNTVSNIGGGMYNVIGLTVIENSTITKNSAPENGGAGVASRGDTNVRTEVRSTVISANDATDVDLVFGSTNSFNSLGSNLVGDGNATGAFDQPGDQVGVENPGLGTLADNGGPTKTHAVQSSSPAIDAVESAGAAAAEVSAAAEPCGVTEDQRDVSRPQDGDGDSTAKCDIGSFELQNSATPPPPPPTEPPVTEPPITEPTSPVPPGPTPSAPKPPVTNPKPPKNPNACTIKGNGRDNVLRGTARRDVICGFGGNDIIRGLGGNDLIRGGAGHDIIYGNNGKDRLLGQRGNDSLFGGRGRDVLLGGPGKNALVGGPGKDVERGGVTPSKNKKQTKRLINNIFKQVGLR